MSWLDLAFSAALLAVLAPLAIVDFRSMVIPDPLNLLLALLGLLYQYIASGALPLVAIAFATSVFAGFWLVRNVYRRLRGIAGLGLGDVKMAAASAIWFSPWNLPLFLFVAAFSALVYVLVFLGVRGQPGTRARVPFGPFIGIGLIVTWALERAAFPTFIPDRGF